MVERVSGTAGDDAPVAPPIPSFESLRAPRRRSAIDLLLPPAESPVEPGIDAPEPLTEEPLTRAPLTRAPLTRAPAPSTAAAPRPAEWGDLLVLGTRLGGFAVRLVAAGLTELRTMLRG